MQGCRQHALSVGTSGDQRGSVRGLGLEAGGTTGLASTTHRIAGMCVPYDGVEIFLGHDLLRFFMNDGGHYLAV